MNDFQKAQRARILACYGETPESILEKSEENDLEKGGEGSRGGKIIGHTRSGKPIYKTKNPEQYKDFTPEDHGDAAYAHWNLGGPWLNNKTSRAHYDKMEAHEKLSDDNSKLKQISRANAERESKGDKVEKAESDEKFAKVMKDFKDGLLKAEDGSLITKRSQAIVIAMSESGRNMEKAEENELEKGIVDDLSYQSKDSGFITTTGKEMKAKLEAVKTRNAAELANIAVKQAALIAQIGCEPDRDDTSYQLEKYKGLIPIPKTYSYNYNKSVETNVPYLYEVSKTEVSEVNIEDLKSQYRDLVYKAINLQVENLQIDTFTRNTKDDKEISLNLQIATALGF